MQARIQDVIRDYSAEGFHRTGTEVDEASAAALAGRIKAIGLDARLTPFPFRRLVIRRAALSAGGLEIPGVPLFDGGTTDLDGVTGTLGPIGSDAEIGVGMTLPTWATDEGRAIAEARRTGRHQAIVVVTDTRLPADGIALINADDYTEPFGPPVLQVANRHHGAIFDAVKAGQRGRVVAHCERVPGQACNVAARIPGRDPALAPLIVMTPRSGWWRCASERGGDTAAWLEMMRAVTALGPRRDVIFTANTGHELGHLGLEHFLSEQRGLVQGAAAWIHLGANFAAKVTPGVRLQFSDPELRDLLTPIMAREDARPATETPLGERPLGEARNIHDGGGRYVSILGRNGLFHHPDDIWPSAVDLAATLKWVSVFTALVVELAD